MPHRKEAPHDPRETGGKGPPEEHFPAQQSPPSPPPSIPDTILQFLNALPTTGDAIEWIGAFRTLLEGLFEDVDRVDLRVNLRCPLVADQSPILHLASAKTSRTRRTRHSVDEAHPLYVSVPEHAFPAGLYQEPSIYEYRFAGGAYLGTIHLRREQGKEPISEETRSSVIALKPFILFALSDLVARYSYAKPIGRMFHEVVHGIALERGLTQRELEVLTLHLFGRKYDEIANRLYISIDTVKKHVKRIHRKTESRSAMELFARYFTPLIDSEALSGGEEGEGEE